MKQINGNTVMRLLASLELLNPKVKRSLNATRKEIADQRKEVVANGLQAIRDISDDEWAELLK